MLARAVHTRDRPETVALNASVRLRNAPRQQDAAHGSGRRHRAQLQQLTAAAAAS